MLLVEGADFLFGMSMDRLELLLSQLSCGDDEQAEETLTHIAAWGAAAVGALESNLSHPEADVRWWIVRALANIPDERVPGLLVGALSDSDQGVRWCAGLALRTHPSEQAVPALVKLLDDKDALTRRLVGDALVGIGSPAVPSLLDVMQQENTPARLEAVRCLARIGDERAIPVLFDSLDDGSALVEYWANEGLERMGVGMVFFKPE